MTFKTVFDMVLSGEELLLSLAGDDNDLSMLLPLLQIATVVV